MRVDTYFLEDFIMHLGVTAFIHKVRGWCCAATPASPVASNIPLLMNIPWIKLVSELVIISTPDAAAHYFMEHVFAPFTDFIQEELVVLLLDTAHVVRYEVRLYRGTLCGMDIRVAEVFREAIRFNAAAILIAHNHPSGRATPSLEDRSVTRTLLQAGDLLGIPVLDHLIIGEQAWTSLRQPKDTNWTPMALVPPTEPYPPLAS